MKALFLGVTVILIGLTMWWCGVLTPVVSVTDEKKTNASNSSSSATTTRGTSKPSTTSLICRIGNAPWKGTSKDQWDLWIQEFTEIYRRRPDPTNKGGGGFFHYFGIFVIIRKIQPVAILESGAWKGVGTWFLRQMAGDDVKIIVISPEQPSTYVDPKGLYFTENKFIDFSKTTIDQWKEWVPDIERTLLFIDDHQAGIRRLREAKAMGFRHMIFDDNYGPGSGDNFSLKKACSGIELWNFIGAPIEWVDNFSKTKKDMTSEQFTHIENECHENVAVYAEFPPPWKGPSRFPEMNKTELLFEPPLFTKDSLAELGIKEDDTAGWDEESLEYTFLLYARIKH